MKKLLVAVLLVVLTSVSSARADLLSPDDERIYQKAFEAAHNEEYPYALTLAKKARDPLLRKVLLWMRFNDPNSGASFAEITDFIHANPDWPQLAALERRAEEAITAADPDGPVLAWFQSHAALTVDGAMAHGRALLKAGQVDKAAAVIRAAWISGNFGPIQEKQFLDNFDSVLRREDHLARLDRLLWDRQETAASHQMLRVDSAHRQLAEARLALALDAGNAKTLVERVPPTLRNDPGLLFELVRYRRSHDDDERAVKLLRHAEADKVRPNMWWAERSILARHALRDGRADLAYEVASNHGPLSGVQLADSEWLSGWIALRFLKRPQVALDHFARMYQQVKTPQSRSRAAYWACRAAEALTHPDEASHWAALAAHYVTTYYGQLAMARTTPATQWPLPADPLPNATDIAGFERQELVRAAKMLAAIHETDLTRPFMLRLNELARTPGQRALAANLATSLGRADIAVTVAKRSEREGVPLITSGYPIPALIRTTKGPERALLLGLIRQESAFHYEAVSSAGARGLMQLMPTTAERVAKDMNVRFRKKSHLVQALTADPALNVKLGAAYLEGVLDNFGGSYILSVAAYNAGPARVKRWLQEIGDPRRGEIDAVDWIESIPYGETRNYVQRVMEGVQVYRRRLGAPGTVSSLETDLRR